MNHQLESRMRENRPSGSEGGGAEPNRLSLPLFGLFTHSLRCGIDGAEHALSFKAEYDHPT